MRIRNSFLAIATAFVMSCSRPQASENLPIAEYPDVVELGVRERGEVAVARFVVANRGTTVLVMDRFQSNCSCSGIERRRGSGYYGFDELRVEPGEEVELQFRVSVRGVPIGAEARNATTFRTNDPTKPEGKIEAVIRRVTGGVHVVPETVILGSVIQGTEVRKTFEVLDDAITPRRLTKITSSSPRIVAKVLEMDQVMTGKPSVHTGKRIAHVEVIADTSIVGSLDSTLTLHVGADTRIPDEIRVLGKVDGLIAVSPEAIVLPRKSAGGLIYSARCNVRSTRGKTLTVSADHTPLGLEFKLVGETKESGIVQVEVAIDRAYKRTAPTETIRLKCVVDGMETIVPLRVHFEDSQ